MLKKNGLAQLPIKVRKSEYDFDDRLDGYEAPFKCNQFWDIKQWKWLESSMNQTTASIIVILSSIQILATEHPYEKWANFPKAQKRFIDLLEKNKIQTPIYLSGDRHIAEISARELKSKSTLYDVTSSGLTHSYDSLKEEVNPFRISPLITHLNFGMLQINWEKSILQVQILDVEGNPSTVHNILF